MFKYAGESIFSCSTPTTSPPGSTASESSSPFTTRKASRFTVFCSMHRWDRALFIQTGPSFRLIEESQRSPGTSNRTLVEAPAWTSSECRLHHGTYSLPLLWYQCKQVAGLASTKMLYCFQPEPESLLLSWYSEAKGLYASLDHMLWPSDPWNQLTPVVLKSSLFWFQPLPEKLVSCQRQHTAIHSVTGHSKYSQLTTPSHNHPPQTPTSTPPPPTLT